MAGDRILIADDDAESIKFLRDALLNPRGYSTLSAADGEEALRLALTEHPDLMLLEVQMPKMGGLEVLQALSDQGCHVPTILIAAHGSEHLAVQAFRLGVRDYFPKPFKVAEVLAAVDRSLVEVGLRREKEELSARLESANRQLGQRLRELSTLYGISKAVASVLDLDQLLTRVVEASRYVTGAEEASLFLRDEETGRVQLRAVQGAQDPRARPVSRSVEDELVNQVLAKGRVIVGSSGQTGANNQGLLRLAVPLLLRGRAIGVLCAHRTEATGQFSDNERYLLSALADHAAIAIDNARLYEATQRELTQRRQAEETIKQLAYHDTLTGLPNRMLFRDRLRVALAQARRHQDRVAVMMLDLDDFKRVNDTLGHAAGDQLLKAVGQRLVAMLRESDTVCRMGGDEFLLLLSEMERPDFADKVAERILERIRQPFTLEDRPLRITTSIGSALYPDDGGDGDTLIKNADIAMYAAKQMGRDNHQRCSSPPDVEPCLTRGPDRR